MTSEEAIKHIKSVPLNRLNQKQCDGLEIAIESLEKQIPKKWGYEMVNDDDTYVCPCCKEYWYMECGNPTTNEYNYCPNCGQALKWE